jgi:glutamate/tyrosine decarboxylase-like PLP-dependent enzyme
VLKISQLIDDFSEYAKRYIEDLKDCRVYPDRGATSGLRVFDTPLQEEPIDPGKVLMQLNEFGSPATVRSTSGRYFGFVTGGSLPASLSGKLLATVWDQNTAMSVMSPVVSKLETVAGAWLIDLFGLPAESGFGFVTGDTMANFTALAAARHQLLKNLGWDVEAKGMFRAPEIRVIVGQEVHVSVLKALSMLGFGKDRIISVAADDQGRMVASKINVDESPTIICTQAGNVNTGAFDPIEEICLLRNENVWVHVDAAFGMWAAASGEKRYLAKGIERADSWATDAHKWLNVPYDCGVVLVRNKESIFSSMSATAAYLKTDDVREPFHYVPEMSREARAIPVWAALKSLGKRGVAELVERNCNQAVLFSELLRDAGCIILNEVVLNQVLVSFGDAVTTRKVIELVQKDGVCWCGETSWQGNRAMRISVSGWNTTEDDIRKSAESVVKCVLISR